MKMIQFAGSQNLAHPMLDTTQSSIFDAIMAWVEQTFGRNADPAGADCYCEVTAGDEGTFRAVAATCRDSLMINLSWSRMPSGGWLIGAAPIQPKSWPVEDCK